MAVVSDNVNYNVGAFKRHLSPRSSNVRHVRCIAHVLNLVGTFFRDRKAFAVLHDYMSRTRRFLKGKKNVRRRKCLPHFFRRHPDGGNVNVPPNWAGTQWSGWFDCVKWHAKHFVFFREWLTVEVSNDDCPGTVSDLYD